MSDERHLIADALVKEFNFFGSRIEIDTHEDALQVVDVMLTVLQAAGYQITKGKTKSIEREFHLRSEKEYWNGK